MKIDFRKVPVFDIEGKPQKTDLSKPVGNLIYELTGDIGEMDIARDIYHKGIVDLNNDALQNIRDIIRGSKIRAYLKMALLEYLKPQENGTK